MLILRIDEEVGEDDDHEEILSANGCNSAVEARSHFLSLGTVVECVSGVAHLIRLHGKEASSAGDIGSSALRHTGSSAGSIRERKESAPGPQDDAQDHPQATQVVYIPAVPSYIPLWSLFSAENSSRVGFSASRSSRASCASHAGGQPVAAPKCDDGLTALGAGSRLGSKAMDGTVRSATVTSKSNSGVRVRVGVGVGCIMSRTRHRSPGIDEKECVGPILAHVAAGEDDSLEFSEAAMEDSSFKAEGNRAAIRRIQVITMPEARYRYSVMLHFGRKADAVAFVEEFNGMSLGGAGVLKALFISSAEIIPANAVGGGNTGLASGLHRRRRRSLSDGVSLAAANSPSVGGRAWRWESNFAREKHGGQSCSPRRERLHGSNISGDGGDCETYPQSFSSPNGTTTQGQGQSHQARLRTRPVSPTSSSGSSLDDSSTSPCTSRKSVEQVKYMVPRAAEYEALEEMIVAEEKTSAAGASSAGRGARERKGEDSVSSGGSTSPPPSAYRSFSASATLGKSGVHARLGSSRVLGHRRTLYSLAQNPRAYIGSSEHAVHISGGDNARASESIGVFGSELPPCPVCLDRLDPNISGVLPARVRPRSLCEAFTSSGAKCRHRSRARALGASGKDDDGDDDGDDGRDADLDTLAVDPRCSCRPLHGSANGVMHNTRGQVSGRIDGEDSKIEDTERSPSPSPSPSLSLSPGDGLGGPRWLGGMDGLRAGTEEAVETALNLTMWRDSTCPVCRCLNVALEGDPDAVRCETCRVAHNLWICMVCGHVGCGRYTQEHANLHSRLSLHNYSLELSTGRIWDYRRDSYAHRALRGQLRPHDPKAIRTHGQGWSGFAAGAAGATGAGDEALGGGRGGRGTRESSPRLYSEGGGFEGHGPVEGSGDGWGGGGTDSFKMAVVSREYETLVSRQLQEQQRYFEGLIAKAIAAEAQAHAPADEGLTDAELEEISRLRKDVDTFSQQYDGLVDSLRKDEEAGRRIRSQNRALIAEQHAQKTAISRVREETVEAKRLCERQMVELEGQMKDLNFYIRTQHEVKASPQSQELVGGSLVMGAGNEGTSNVSANIGESRAGGKGGATAGRLARRLRERSDARRAAGGGGAGGSSRG